MAKLFDYNNPIWRFMGRIADMFFLTILWLICSIPIITIGAATNAVYYITLKMVRNREEYIFRTFFRCFKENFLSSTIIWIVLLAIGMIPVTGFCCLNNIESPGAPILFWPLIVVTVLYLFTVTLVFPLSARLDVKIGKLFFLTFMVQIKNFPWILLMLVTSVCAIALGIFVFWPILIIIVGSIAYIHALILEYIIFPKYNWNEI